jgi:hypothetical protein
LQIQGGLTPKARSLAIHPVPLRARDCDNEERRADRREEYDECDDLASECVDKLSHSKPLWFQVGDWSDVGNRRDRRGRIESTEVRIKCSKPENRRNHRGMLGRHELRPIEGGELVAFCYRETEKRAHRQKKRCLQTEHHQPDFLHGGHDRRFKLLVDTGCSAKFRELRNDVKNDDEREADKDEWKRNHRNLLFDWRLGRESGCDRGLRGV